MPPRAFVAGTVDNLQPNRPQLRGLGAVRHVLSLLETCRNGIQRRRRTSKLTTGALMCAHLEHAAQRRGAKADNGHFEPCVAQRPSRQHGRPCCASSSTTLVQS